MLLCKKRHRDVVVLVPSDEGDVAVMTRVGGVMGDPFMVAAFSTTFQRPVQQWTESLRAADPSLHLLRADWQGQE
eukprot:8053470-Pyramimonas_sp.AAC.1